jgi:hypothetical protein
VAVIDPLLEWLEWAGERLRGKASDALQRADWPGSLEELLRPFHPLTARELVGARQAPNLDDVLHSWPAVRQRLDEWGAALAAYKATPGPRAGWQVEGARRGLVSELRCARAVLEDWYPLLAWHPEELLKEPLRPAAGERTGEASDPGERDR